MKTSPKFLALLSTALVAPAIFLSSTALAREGRSLTAKQMTELLPPTQNTTSANTARNRMHRNGQSRRNKDTLDRLRLWNEVMLDANALDHTPAPGSLPGNQNGPTRTTRAFAIVQIAVFDAANSFQQKFHSYTDMTRAPAGASMDAAIAFAAHDTLIALYPNQKTRIDEILTTDLSTVKGTDASVAAGKLIGETAAQQILARRAADGSQVGEMSVGTGPNDYHVNPAAGHWSPDPAGRTVNVALGATWGQVTPFVLTSGSQFRLPAPPAPNTDEYRAGFKEVSTVGASTDTAGSTSTERTRFIGNFWGYDGAPLLGTPPRLYNQIARVVADKKGMRDVVDYARYLAAINTVMADCGITAWNNKYFHDYWRPVTAVRRADEDGDATTVADPIWKPVGASIVNVQTVQGPFTPPFPAYPSGHSTFGSGLFETMRHFFPNNTPFTFTSDEYNGEGVDPNGTPRPLVPVRFQSLRQAELENGKSRIYNGVHWEWDNTGGAILGTNVAAYTAANAFRRR